MTGLWLIVSLLQSVSTADQVGATAETVGDTPFSFGSYGRINFSSDLDGGRGQPAQVVPWGPRLNEASYLELDFGMRLYRGPDANVRMMTTLAFDDGLFHYTGQWDVNMALRQFYLEAANLYGTGMYAWVGSRYFRGDDIYLFSWWPMDDLNTLGGAVGWAGPDTTLTVHVGMNRLEDEFQVQRVPVPANDFGAEQAVFLDRQRMVAAALAEQRFGGKDGALGWKLKLYGELHYLPKGRRTLEGSTTETEPLSDDRGTMLGAQFGMWNFAKNGHLNVWVRYATGLAAYDELGLPYGLNTDRRAVDAQEFRVAYATNAEFGAFGIQSGGYARVFLDADGIDEDFDDRQEFAVAVRPHYMMGIFNPAIELSVQGSRPNGLNPRTNEQSTAYITQIGFIPAFTFGDNIGTYTRPQLRAIYSISLLNQAALDRYAAQDPRADADVVHFLGVGAEWWFGRGGGY